MGRPLIGFLLLFVGLAGPVDALEPYFGLAAGRASLETSITGIDLDFDIDLGGDDVGYKLFGGARAGRFLALEGSLFDLGQIDDGFLGFDVRAEVRGASAVALGRFSAGRLDFFGKLGIAYWQFDSLVTGPGGGTLSNDDAGTDVTYGVGLSVRIFRFLVLRAEWEVFELDVADDVSFASVGVEFRL